jgi:hypothetical protein
MAFEKREGKDEDELFRLIIVIDYDNILCFPGATPAVIDTESL